MKGANDMRTAIIMLLCIGGMIFPFCKATAHEDYIRLDTGMYGVPFNTSLQGVLEWCEKNSVKINNPTKQQIEKEIARIKADNFFVRKNDAENMYIMREAQKKLDMLKESSFEWRGQDYLLNREFVYGTIDVGGVQRACTTETIYSLEISPSESSANLINNSLASIKIYFQKDNSTNLTSYAAVALFHDEDSTVLSKQLNSIINILSKKYGGKPSLRKMLGFSRECARGEGSGGNASLREGTLEWNTYHLLNNPFYLNDSLMWGMNLAIIIDPANHGRLPDESDGMYLCYDKFYVIYYEPNIALKILDSQQKTMKEFSNTCSREEINKQKQLKGNF